MKFTILWPEGRALNVPAIRGFPDPNSVAAALPYRWRVSWRRREGWWRDSNGVPFCTLRNRRGKPIVTLYATPAP